MIPGVGVLTSGWGQALYIVKHLKSIFFNAIDVNYNTTFPPTPPRNRGGGMGVCYTGIGLSICPDDPSICSSVCRCNTFWGLKCYPFHLGSPYHAYGLLMGQRCSLLNLGSKGQSSSALDIKVAVWFPGSRALSFLPRVTISYIWTTHFL